MSSTDITASMLMAIESGVRAVYAGRAADVPFHGWPHVDFVRSKAAEFARQSGADVALVEAAALLHDMNYLAERASEPEAGYPGRAALLAGLGVSAETQARNERLIHEAHTATRTADISSEARALSDADTLFKALPITPVALSCFFRTENNMSVGALASKIVREQLPLMQQGIYFYSPDVEKRYREWAEVNVHLWTQVLECLSDPDVVKLLGELGLDGEVE